MFFHAANNCTHSARCRWISATAWWIPKRRRTEKVAHRKGGAQRAVIKNCLQYISTHLREDLRLEELAHECGLCSRSLSLKFKAEVGCGIPEYIHRDNPHGV